MMGFTLVAPGDLKNAATRLGLICRREVQNALKREISKLEATTLEAYLKQRITGAPGARVLYGPGYLIPLLTAYLRSKVPWG